MSAMPMCAPGDVTELAILADALGVYVKHTELQSPVLQRFEAAKKAYFLRVGTALGVIQMMQGAPSGKPTGKAKAKRR